MKHKGHEARINAILTIDSASLSLIRKAAVRHYDFICKSSAECGGFLWGVKNRLELPGRESVDHSFTFRELDIMLKIIENEFGEEYREIRATLYKACSKINELSQEINKQLESKN